MNIDRVGNTIRNKIISKSLAAFGFGQIQDAMNIIAILKHREISIDGFMEWGRYMQAPGRLSVHRQLNTDKTNKIYTCPECKLPLILIPVNSEPCSMVGEGYKSLLYCHDEFNCGYELYSEEPLEYWELLSDNINNPEQDVKMVERKSGCGKCGKK